ncbi:MAG TPA: TetR family transcriptional regulator C-terminal domain-containing protein [Aliidongia sp.]|uniref:TetR/AcrR family transcriptional regulator n=1 Tax=Aliidongia sp. TaxID=1914230 RepID=UPI002DDCA618|nr:TetR family transcriptional regulator C-terminal domain-containing protein [Aliidongia sp.]HEV2675818.1 TetR family transcriptional regulator C-terminal domain-containing protein [Aliidongia sp.]
MSKISNRDKILTEGLKVVHERGFSNASVRDIVQAAGVPQGSFTNHFVSKEAFGLEILDIYFANGFALIRETLLNDDLPPLRRMQDYVEANKDRLNESGMRNGCLFGNFTAEASDHSEAIRTRLVEIFGEVQDAVAYCLKAARAAGEVSPTLDCDEVAGFFVSSLQGANLLAKALRSPAPIERFKHVLFSTVLRG